MNKMRKTISIGGDSDTIWCVTGGIAQAYFKRIPGHIVQKVRDLLDPRLLSVVDRFSDKYGWMLDERE